MQTVNKPTLGWLKQAGVQAIRYSDGIFSFLLAVHQTKERNGYGWAEALTCSAQLCTHICAKFQPTAWTAQMKFVRWQLDDPPKSIYTSSRNRRDKLVITHSGDYSSSSGVIAVQKSDSHSPQPVQFFQRS